MKDVDVIYVFKEAENLSSETYETVVALTSSGGLEVGCLGL
jgi:hypothetical protein